MLFVCIFAPDEPVRVVLEAARLVPDATVRITGDPRRAPADLLTDLPTNVELTGYLDQASYRRALHEADVVLALTTEPSSVMRAAYEAVNAARPLIVTDWPDLQAAFPYAVATANTADSIAAALQKVSTRLACLEADAGAARLVQADRWRAQLERLREVVGVEGVERIEEVPV